MLKDGVLALGSEVCLRLECGGGQESDEKHGIVSATKAVRSSKGGICGVTDVKGISTVHFCGDKGKIQQGMYLGRCPARVPHCVALLTAPQQQSGPWFSSSSSPVCGPVPGRQRSLFPPK